MRIVHITHGVVPYQTPLFNAIAQRLDLHVVYTSPPSSGASDARWSSFADPWGVAPRFDYSFAPGRSISILSLDFLATLPRRLGPMLDRRAPDVVSVYSWSLGCTSAVLWAQRRDVARMMWTESSEWSGLLRDPITNAYRRHLVKACHAHLVVGPAAREFALKLGATPTSCVDACLPSTASVSTAGARRTPPSGDQLRILWVGRLVDLKRPEIAIEAFNRIVPEIPGASLTIVGDGPLAPRVRAAADRASGTVVLTGRVEGQPLDEIYASHDVLLVTSARDVWSLVVNEALERGLYVVSSDRVGSALSLVEDGTGRLVPADDVEGFVHALRDAFRETRRLMGESGRGRIHQCTVPVFADRYLRAAELAMARREVRTGAGNR